MNQPKTSARLIVAREREREALDLRRAGASYAQIAEKMDLTPGGVYRAVTRAIDRIVKTSSETAEQVRELELQRLDEATLQVMHRVNKGDERAIDTLIKIQARRARLLGLDMPEKIDVNVIEIQPPRKNADPEI